MNNNKTKIILVALTCTLITGCLFAKKAATPAAAAGGSAGGGAASCTPSTVVGQLSAAGGDMLYNIIPLGQSFTLASTQTISNVILTLAKLNAGSTGTMTLTINTDNGSGVPSGVVLATSSDVLDVSGFSTSGVAKTFNFPSILLTPGTYWLVGTTTADVSSGSGVIVYSSGTGSSQTSATVGVSASNTPSYLGGHGWAADSAGLGQWMMSITSCQ